MTTTTSNTGAGSDQSKTKDIWTGYSGKIGPIETTDENGARLETRNGKPYARASIQPDKGEKRTLIAFGEDRIAALQEEAGKDRAVVIGTLNRNGGLNVIRTGPERLEGTLTNVKTGKTNDGTPWLNAFVKRDDKKPGVGISIFGDKAAGISNAMSDGKDIHIKADGHPRREKGQDDTYREGFFIFEDTLKAHKVNRAKEADGPAADAPAQSSAPAPEEEDDDDLVPN